MKIFRKFFQRFHKLFSPHEGQSIIEQATLLILVTMGIVVMGPYAMKSWNAALKTLDDSVKDSQYDPLVDGSIEEYCAHVGAIDGGWSAWSNCICKDRDGNPLDCGSGTCNVTRTCSNPSPMCGGADCSGRNTETRSCSVSACCPQVGEWGPGWVETPCVGCLILKTKDPRPVSAGGHCLPPTIGYDPACPYDCGQAPIETESCGEVNGTFSNGIAGGCVNCLRNVRWECSAKCGGTACPCSSITDYSSFGLSAPPCSGSTYEDVSVDIPCNCGGSCIPANICNPAKDGYYTDFDCNNSGDCVKEQWVNSGGVCTTTGDYNEVLCADEQTIECQTWNEAVCIPGIYGCTPIDVSNAPDGTICQAFPADFPHVHCAPKAPLSGGGPAYSTGWYDAMCCESGGCSAYTNLTGAPCGTYTDCTALYGTGETTTCIDDDGNIITGPGCTATFPIIGDPQLVRKMDSCSIIEPSQCDESAASTNYCTTEQYKNTTGNLCNETDFCDPSGADRWAYGFACNSRIGAGGETEYYCADTLPTDWLKWGPWIPCLTRTERTAILATNFCVADVESGDCVDGSGVGPNLCQDPIYTCKDVACDFEVCSSDGKGVYHEVYCGGDSTGCGCTEKPMTNPFTGSANYELCPSMTPEEATCKCAQGEGSCTDGVGCTSEPCTECDFEEYCLQPCTTAGGDPGFDDSCCANLGEGSGKIWQFNDAGEIAQCSP